MKQQSNKEDYGILMGGKWDEVHTKRTVEDAVEALQEWVQEWGEASVLVLRLRNDKKMGWHLAVTCWYTEACQGQCWPTMILRYVPWNLPIGEFWYTRETVPKTIQNLQKEHQKYKKLHNKPEFLQDAFHVLMGVAIKSGATCTVISDAGHDFMYDNLTKNFERTTTVERLEFGDRYWEEDQITKKNIFQYLGRGLHAAYANLIPARQNRFRNEFRRNWQTTRNALLCTEILSNGRAPSSWKELLFMQLGACNPNAIHKLFKALQSTNVALESLDFRYTRRIHTWNSDGKVSNHRNDPPICILPLVAALRNPKSAMMIKRLDLSGNRLSSDSAVALASSIQAIPTLQELLLRDTSLGPASVIALSREMKQANSLRKLDLSHNNKAFNETDTNKALADLCLALTTNTTLLDLKLEFCGLSKKHFELIAAALPSMMGLRRFSLNGNWDFSLPYCATPGIMRDFMAGGPGILVDALEYNTRLLTFELCAVANNARVCCTGPSYEMTRVSSGKREKLDFLLRRNQKMYEEEKKSRMQEAVVRLATILLPKMKSEQSL